MKRNFFKKSIKRRSKCTSTNRSSKYVEKFTFKSHQVGAIISEKLLSFYKDSEFFDTVLIAGRDCIKIQAHRVVLCALSEYFYEIFRNGQSPSKGNVIEFEEIEASILKLIIDFLYSGSIEMSLETVGDILEIAAFFKINTLIDGCCEFIEKNFNSSNSLNWFRLANKLDLHSLKTRTLEFTYAHFEEISKEKELLMLSKNELKDLLFNNNPHGDFEEVVFLSVVAWIDHDKSKRNHLVFEFLSMVRYQGLTPKFIIENRKSVCKTVESYELICSWLEWHLSPETRTADQQNIAFKPRKMPRKLAAVNSSCDSSEIIIETFNPKSNSWSIEFETSHPTRKTNCSMIVIDEKLIVVGGIEGMDFTNSVECLDLHTLKWLDLPVMKRRREYCQLLNLKGNLCVFGGEVNEDSNDIEIYSFSTSKWHYPQPLCKPSEMGRITAHNGILFILDFVYGSLQSFDVSSNKWTSKAVEKKLLEDFGFAAVEGFLYVIGGRFGQELVETVRRYNLSNDSWCDMASLPKALYCFESTVFENKIITSTSDGAYEYNLDTDTWNTLSPLGPVVQSWFTIGSRFEFGSPRKCSTIGV